MACDTEDFDDFFRVDFPRLVKFLLTNGFGFEQSRDAAMDAMVDAYQRWAQVRNPTAYVRTAGLRAATRHAERDRKRLSRLITSGLTTPEHADPFAAIDALLDARSRLLGLLKCLPSQQRLILALHLDGFKNTEIADNLGMNSATVRSHLRHAKQWLTARLRAQRRTEADDEGRGPL